MLKFSQKTTESVTPDTTLTLTFDQRTKSRLKVTLDDNRAAGIVLENGKSLKHGDFLLSDKTADDDKTVAIEIKAALETVSTVYCDDTLQLARTCYHLGNRHVSLQIGTGFLRYQHDHVLDQMVQGLGLDVHVEQASFEPEAGAYQTASGHAHSH